MSVHFEKLRITQIKKETPDCISILFDVPSDLHEKFAYKHGQHLTLRSFINNEEIRRSYSLCSSPLEQQWKIAIKRAEGGLFSAFAHDQLREGDIMEVMPPLGHFFTELNPVHKKNYIAFAAGSGITPVISIIKTILATEPASEVTLVYGNRNRASIIFRDELEALKDKYIDRFSLIYILSREMTDAELNHGRIDAHKCDLLFDKLLDINSDEYFICGPEEMIFAVKRYLQEHGVGDNRIHFELFTTAESRQPKTKTAVSKQTRKSLCTVRAKLDGIQLELQVDPAGDAIIDAAIEQGIDLPYSCKAGVCSTCKAKLLEGKVEMDADYSLDPEEIKNGFILACQSHPRTPVVVIDFDIK